MEVQTRIVYGLRPQNTIIIFTCFHGFFYLNPVLCVVIDNIEYSVNQISSPAKLSYDSKDNSYHCEGVWSISSIHSLSQSFIEIQKKTEQEGPLCFNGKNLGFFDSAAALFFTNLKSRLEEQGNTVKLVGFSEQHSKLLGLIADKSEFIHYEPPVPRPEPLLEHLGKEALVKGAQITGLLNLIGDLSCKVFRTFGQWRRFRLSAVVSNIDSTGLQALPILALLSFLIGVVLAFQMGLQLKTYGATSFIGYLSGMAIFREFAPLITAIIVAGRTSSAFTAQLGSMKINEEIDALQTMGLSPTELLVLPKVIGLLLAFPLLVFWADFFGLLGAMMMSKSQLDVGYMDFLIKLKESVGVDQFLLGLYKAPAYALIISLVGCFQGFSVQSNADSLGSQTTKSVVQSLFLIIIADAIYSIVYSKMGL